MINFLSKGEINKKWKNIALNIKYIGDIIIFILKITAKIIKIEWKICK